MITEEKKQMIREQLRDVTVEDDNGESDIEVEFECVINLLDTQSFSKNIEKLWWKHVRAFSSFEIQDAVDEALKEMNKCGCEDGERFEAGVQVFLMINTDSIKTYRKAIETWKKSLNSRQKTFKFKDD